MKLIQCGSGLHAREVKCAEALKAALPDSWHAYSNLDLVLGRANTREVDLVIISDHYIFVADAKDWHGKIESREGNWIQNGQDRGASPVKKIVEIQRKVYEKLQGHLKARQETRDLAVPRVIGLVLMSGTADYSGISDLEADNVLSVDQFIKIAKSPNKLRENFGNVAPDHLRAKFSGHPWKQILSRFFNVKSSPFFEPGKKRFQGLLADDAPSFVHPESIYSEFDAREEKIPINTSTLRLWDFSKCSNARFQTEEGRSEIAGRERSVFHWLRDRNSFTENFLLTPTSHDVENSVDYWEAYERRQNQKRLSDFIRTEIARLTREERLELSRQILAAVATLHDCGAAHLDLGAHSIWLEAPTTVRLSHLMAAHTPENRSLGADRYQFLSSVTLPEVVLDIESSPQKRDVFLVGSAIHSILFGSPPKGNPPDWSAEIDADNIYEKLHAWFATVLEHDPAKRVRTCSDALSMFNKATEALPSSANTIERIETEHSSIRSQMQAARMFPLIDDFIVDSNALEAWISKHDERTLLVKMWKQSAIGDIKKNASKILAFLERAKDLQADQPCGLAPIRHYSWLSDALIVAQDWVAGHSLEESLEIWSSNGGLAALDALELAKKVLETTESIHEENISHGDLKPSNVIVTEDNQIVFIDVLDLQLDLDGGANLSEYAPVAGDNFERDRFSAIKMGLEIIHYSNDEFPDIKKIEKNAEYCLNQEPALATFYPLHEEIVRQIEIIRNPPLHEENTKSISISLRNAETGPIEADEGRFYFRHRVARNQEIEFVHIRGAAEEIMVALSPDWEIRSVRRQKVLQENLIRNANNELFNLEMSLSVQDSAFNSFNSLSSLFEEIGLKSILGEHSDEESSQDEVDVLGSTDADQDILAEKVEAETADGEMPARAKILNVPELWRKLIDVESQLTIEARSTNDSWFDDRLRLTAVPIELETGQIDFDREDTVFLEKETRNGNWAKLGKIDVRQSRNDIVFVDSFWGRELLRVDEGTRLRFESFFTSESLKRRKDAVDKILQGSGRVSELLSAFDVRSGVLPNSFSWEPDEELIKSYGLNIEQEQALRGAISTRPLSLVQGPPGTGKTRFIAALTHYALTQGLARSVLLSSQSHEAVNTAIDGVLKHFAKEGEKPSVFRVGANTVDATGELQQYFARNLEQSLKNRFSASFRERIHIAGKALGVPQEITDKICTVETTITDMSNALQQLRTSSLSSAGQSERVHNLNVSLDMQIATLVSDPSSITSSIEFEEIPDMVVSRIQSQDCRPQGIGENTIAKLREIARLAKDFVGSSSSISRSFEPFFAGTRQIVAGTCVGLGKRSLGLTSSPFDLVIVDEAARCTSSELLVPLQASRWTVLVGDQAQLQPHHEASVVETVARELNINRSDVLVSDFERVFGSTYAAQAGFSLQRQYRMLPVINQIVARTFYPNLQLTSDRSEPIIPPKVLSEISDTEVAWIETDSLGKEGFESTPQGSASKVNEAEASAIVHLIEAWCGNPIISEWLDNQNEFEAGIGVICMYAAQRDLVKRKLNMSAASKYLNRGVKIGTVDSYQGKENPVVVLSLVRNNSSGPAIDGMKSIREGFLVAPNRVNVAFSRAMDRLFIVGARKSWRPGTPIARAASEFGELASIGKATVIRAEYLLDKAQEPEKQKEKAK